MIKSFVKTPDGEIMYLKWVAIYRYLFMCFCLFSGCDDDQSQQQQQPAQQQQQPQAPHPQQNDLTPQHGQPGTPHTPLQNPHTPQPHTPQSLINHPLANPALPLPPQANQNLPYSQQQQQQQPMPNNNHNSQQQQPQLPQQQQPPPQQQQQHGSAQMSMESHFMQQQSQIFVFSTQLANAAAECVLSGQHKSIISFHLEQPGTKKFLQVCTSFFIVFWTITEKVFFKAWNLCVLVKEIDDYLEICQITPKWRNQPSEL